MHLIDCTSEDVVKSYQDIRSELTLYNPNLAEKPEVVVLSKADSLDAAEIVKKQKKLEKACGKKVFVISSIAKQGIWEALHEINQFITRERRSKDDEENLTDSEPEDKIWSPI